MLICFSMRYIYYTHGQRFSSNSVKPVFTKKASKRNNVFRFFVSYFSIGNAMGYVRMIRSGGLHCCSNAIR